MAKDFPPDWWPSTYSVEQLATDVTGRLFEEAMYAVLAADCNCFVRQVDRARWDAPDSYDPERVQLFVSGNRVTSAKVG